MEAKQWMDDVRHALMGLLPSVACLTLLGASWAASNYFDDGSANIFSVLLAVLGMYALGAGTMYLMSGGQPPVNVTAGIVIGMACGTAEKMGFVVISIGAMAFFCSAAVQYGIVTRRFFVTGIRASHTRRILGALASLATCVGSIALVLAVKQVPAWLIVTITSVALIVDAEILRPTATRTAHSS